MVPAFVDHRRNGGPITPAAALASQRNALAAAPIVSSAAADAPSATSDLIASGPAANVGGSTSPAGGKAATPNAPAPAAPSGGGGSSGGVLPFPPPQVPVPAVPDALKPLAGLASPMSFFACQYLGLVPLASALGGALGLPISLSDLLPYMKPVFDVCLIPGVPAVDANCALDQQIDEGVGLPDIPVALDLTLGEVIQGVPIPRPEALVIQEFVQLERLLLGEPTAASRPSDALASALGCALS